MDYALFFMGVEFDIEYDTDSEGCFIESITIAGSDELYDEFSESFIDKINDALTDELTGRMRNGE